MKIVIEISHPARVHLFRNLYFQLLKKGHKIIVVYKDKEQTSFLLKLYKIPAYKIGKNRIGSFKKLI